MPTSSVLLDLTQYVRINSGYTSVLLQAHRDDVRIVMSDTQPATNNSSFHLIGGADPALLLPTIDTNVWALPVSVNSSLIVTEEADTPEKRYKASDLDTAAAIKYFGYLTVTGAWYVLKFDTTANTMRFVKGSGGYTTAWTNRATQAYDYLHNVF